uniref:Uncharacterized protein n=1 Tax=viral metagenome TaxID=1070528 RepID=A0A6C0KHW9_9ZZZZ
MSDDDKVTNALDRLKGLWRKNKDKISEAANNVAEAVKGIKKDVHELVKTHRFRARSSTKRKSPKKMRKSMRKTMRKSMKKTKKSTRSVKK